MAFEQNEIEKIEKSMMGFFEKHRPPEKIRHIYDLGYSIENQSVIIFEIRTLDNGKGRKIYPTVGKVTYVRRHKIWKIFWERADFKWHPYDPVPKVWTFNQFLKVVSLDKFGCFFG